MLSLEAVNSRARKLWTSAIAIALIGCGGTPPAPALEARTPPSRPRAGFDCPATKLGSAWASLGADAAAPLRAFVAPTWNGLPHPLTAVSAGGVMHWTVQRPNGDVALAHEQPGGGVRLDVVPAAAKDADALGFLAEAPILISPGLRATGRPDGTFEVTALASPKDGPPPQRSMAVDNSGVAWSVALEVEERPPPPCQIDCGSEVPPPPRWARAHVARLDGSAWRYVQRIAVPADAYGARVFPDADDRVSFVVESSTKGPTGFHLDSKGTFVPKARPAAMASVGARRVGFHAVREPAWHFVPVEARGDEVPHPLGQAWPVGVAQATDGNARADRLDIVLDACGLPIVAWSASAGNPERPAARQVHELRWGGAAWRAAPTRTVEAVPEAPLLARDFPERAAVRTSDDRILVERPSTGRASSTERLPFEATVVGAPAIASRDDRVCVAWLGPSRDLTLFVWCRAWEKKP